MVKSISIFLSIFLFTNQCISQTKFVYEYSYNTQFAGIKNQFSLYYWVDSTITFKCKKITFYKFTFATDSSENSGFIAHDKNTGDVYYIHDTLEKQKGQAQMIFNISKQLSKKVHFFPFVGYDFELYCQRKKEILTFNIRYLNPKDSHSIYLSVVEFDINRIVPKVIVVFFPFEATGLVKLYPREIPSGSQ